MGNIGEVSGSVLFIDPADNRSNSLGKQGERGEGGRWQSKDKGRLQENFTCGKKKDTTEQRGR